MKYAIAILVSLALLSLLPDLAGSTHTTIGVQAFSFSQSVRSSMAWALRVVSGIPQPVWLVSIGVLLIVISWFVRRGMSWSASQSRD
jgi:hypothetical protein